MSRHMHYICIVEYYLILRSYVGCRADSLPDKWIVFYFIRVLCCRAPILITAQSKSWVCGRSLAGIAGSNRIGGMVVSPLGLLCVDR
jgi:hypothetical protein